MSMLADAGVDVLIMDVTNAECYWDEWEVVFSVMEKMKAEGNKVPQFCFWAFNGPSITVVQDLYEKIYRAGKYKDLWFFWDGKPLLLYNGTPGVDANGQVPQHPNPNYDPKAKSDTNHPHYRDPGLQREILQGLHEGSEAVLHPQDHVVGIPPWAGQRFVGTEDNWSFGYDLGDERVKAMNPDELVSRHNGVKEEAAVTPAQHPSSLIGKSWTREHGEPPAQRVRSAASHLRAVARQDRGAPRGLRDLFPAAMERGDRGQPAVPVYQRLERMDGGQVPPGRRANRPLHAAQERLLLRRPIQCRVQSHRFSR